MKLTPQQKLAALAYRFYQGAPWTPKAGDYYTTSRADMELYQVVAVESGVVRTRYTEGSDVIAEWREREFLTEGFGPKRVYVPEWVLAMKPTHEDLVQAVENQLDQQEMLLADPATIRRLKAERIIRTIQLTVGSIHAPTNAFPTFLEFEQHYPSLNWHIAKGRLTADEPLYGALIFRGDVEIGSGESNISAPDAFEIAFRASGLAWPPEEIPAGDK